MPEQISKNGEGNLRVSLPLDDWVIRIAKEAAREAALAVVEEIKHSVYADCPGKKRLDLLGLKFYVLCAFLSGIGILNVWSLIR